jgi:hypothetical protein
MWEAEISLIARIPDVHIFDTPAAESGAPPVPISLRARYRLPPATRCPSSAVPNSPCGLSFLRSIADLPIRFFRLILYWKPTLVSGSSSIGNNPRFQAHLVLDNSARLFGLFSTLKKSTLTVHAGDVPRDRPETVVRQAVGRQSGVRDAVLEARPALAARTVGCRSRCFEGRHFVGTRSPGSAPAWQWSANWTPTLTDQLRPPFTYSNRFDL